jgi:uncharacterized protein with HEPN domain
MSEKYLKYVNDFITGDIDHLIDMFGSIENILKFFHRKDLLQYIDDELMIKAYENEKD